MKKTIVFYDGGCSMCVGVTGWLSRIDHKEQFELVPFQNAEILSKYPQIKPADCENEMHLVTETGIVLKGADAVLEIWRKSEHWSSFFASIFKLPPFIWLARPIYRLIARNRKLIYG